MLKNKIEIMIVSPEMHYNLHPPQKKKKKKKKTKTMFINIL